MLVLTRKEGEKVCIGDDVVITVVANGNDRVRLGIEAPRDVVVLRAELQKKNEEENAGSTIPMKAVVPAVRCG
jgi:carbon storage regulator